MSENLRIGEPIVGYQVRDAIHLAVVPMEAGETISPGCPVAVRNGLAVRLGQGMIRSVGVVDPFLHVPINKGERFWLFLKPGSITSLRHEWTHPDFPETATDNQKVLAMARMEELAKEIGPFTASDLVNYYTQLATLGYASLYGSSDLGLAPTEFWILGEIITGLPIDAAEKRDHYFACSC